MSKARNLVVIMSDEHDPRHSGCYGSAFVKTPHIDALAASGVRFTHAYTPSPICVPARAAFATGRRVFEARLWDNAMPYFGQIRGWGHELQAHGVSVESVGKLHYRAQGDDAGFDKEHYPMHVVGGHGMVWASIRDPYIIRNPKGRMLGDKIGRGESPYTQYDAQITQASVQWLTERGERQRSQSGLEQPFVLYIGFVAPHFPLLAPPAFYDLYQHLPEQMPKLHPRTGYKRHPWVQQYADFEHTEPNFRSPEERQAAFRAYYGLCSYLDSNIGQILQALQSSGLAQNTNIVYTADHGDNLGARGLWGKSTLYEESVRIPMILAGPDVQPGTCETPVDLLDLYPTILQSAAVAPTEPSDKCVGTSLFDIAKAPVNRERPIFSEYHAAGSNTAGFMLRKGRWKFLYYVRHEPELFDLQSDPEELHDLSNDPAHREVRLQMEHALRAICDPEAVDAMAKHDQGLMIQQLGGAEIAASMGASGATPAPK